IASSFDSFDPAASPAKPGSSVIHLCMSVKRTVSGSVSGYLSASAIAISSKLSQPNVGGISGSLVGADLYVRPFSGRAEARPYNCCVYLVVRFLRVILVPVGNFHDDVGRAVGHGLAAETRLRCNPWRFIKFVEFRVSRFVTRLQSLLNDDVTRRASAHAAARVVESEFEPLGNVQDASRQAVMAVGDFFRINFNRLAAGKKRHLVFLRGGLVLDFFDVWIRSAHFHPRSRCLRSICSSGPQTWRNLSSSALTSRRAGGSMLRPVKILNFRDFAPLERCRDRAAHQDFRQMLGRMIQLVNALPDELVVAARQRFSERSNACINL